MKIGPPLQEDCVNVKPAYFKHTFKEGILPLKPVSVRTRTFSTLNMSLLLIIKTIVLYM